MLTCGETMSAIDKKLTGKDEDFVFWRNTVSDNIARHLANGNFDKKRALVYMAKLINVLSELEMPHPTPFVPGQGIQLGARIFSETPLTHATGTPPRGQGAFQPITMQSASPRISTPVMEWATGGTVGFTSPVARQPTPKRSTPVSSYLHTPAHVPEHHEDL